MNRNSNSLNLSTEEIQQALEVLSRLEPGRLPLEIFLEVVRLTVTPILEVVPLRKNPNGKVQVLLIQREKTDPVWGGMWHTPGTVIRASDTASNNQDAFERILIGELKGVKTSEPVFVTNLLHRVKRGMEQSQIYWVEVLAEPSIGSFYDADRLPESTVSTQLGFIKSAIISYESHNQQGA